MKTPSRTKARNHRKIARLSRIPDFGMRSRHRVPKSGIPKIGTLKRTERNKLLILPLRPPASPNAPSRSRREGFSNFRNLWDAWPEAERPDNRRYAARLFEQLTAQDRRKSVQLAKAFRTVRSGQGSFAPMITYLRERLFLEFDGGPEIDREGYFIIKPHRAEWSAWIEQTREMFGEKGVEAARRTGFFLRRTRWPEGHPSAEGWRHGGGKTDQRSRRNSASRRSFRPWRQEGPAAVSANGGR